VRLVASNFGPSIPGIGRAYHTSILIDDIEFEYGGDGINKSHGPMSHARFGEQPEIIDMGATTQTPKEMLRALQWYFQRGTYDMLRKNCNSFSKCAVFYLVGLHMDSKYESLEQIGASLDRYTSLIRLIISNYEPNPSAEGFSTDLVIRDLEWSGVGAASERRRSAEAQTQKPKRGLILRASRGVAWMRSAVGMDSRGTKARDLSVATRT
ncbi:unnamed protein product, partial [Polarella glacialis]